MKAKCKRIKKSLGPQITQCWGMTKLHSALSGSTSFPPPPRLLLCYTQPFVSMTTMGEQEKNRCGGGDGGDGSSGGDSGW